MNSNVNVLKTTHLAETTEQHFYHRKTKIQLIKDKKNVTHKKVLLSFKNKTTFYCVFGHALFSKQMRV